MNSGCDGCAWRREVMVVVEDGTASSGSGGCEWLCCVMS